MWFDYGAASYVVSLLAVLIVYRIVIRKMAKANSPLFKIGYYLYAKTRIGQLYYRRELSKSRRKFQNEGHSVCEAHIFNGLKILPIAMSLDNYGYLILDSRTGTAVLVDPADCERVQQVLDAEKCVPSAILTTHKHWDHAGGNAEWKRRYPDVRIYGCATDNIPAVTDTVMEGDVLTFGQFSFSIQFTPGHTVGHVIYILDSTTFNAPPSVFSGDVLFIGGIGRMFEGSPAIMQRSLDSIMQLPEQALLWPGHEYTQDNLEFAASLEPENEAIQNKLKWAQEQRKEKMCTCPSMLGEEKSYNPFLRTDKDSIAKALGMEQEKDQDKDTFRATVLGEIRARKDKFKYKL